MSRRPRLDPMSVAMGGLSRMNSNGRTLPSEAPVQRPILTVQARASAGVGTYIPGAAPLYWWKFDEASGGAALEVNGGPSIVWEETWVAAGYHAPALAPGSLYATSVDFEEGQTGFFEDATPGLGAGPDGLIVLDFWCSGLLTDPTPGWGSAGLILLWQNGGTNPAFEMSIGNLYGGPSDPYRLCFTIDNVYILTVPAPWDDPAHVRWEINPAAGTSVILINDAEVSNEAGLSVGWVASAPWSLMLANSWMDATWDELKIYGAES